MSSLYCNAHPDMKKVWQTSFDQCHKYYHQPKVPAMVYIPFFQLIKVKCNGHDSVVNSQIHLIMRTTIGSQKAIGGELTLQGYFTDKWFIQHLAPDKSDQQLSHLYLGVATYIHAVTRTPQYHYARLHQRRNKGRMNPTPIQTWQVETVPTNAIGPPTAIADWILVCRYTDVAPNKRSGDPVDQTSVC